MPMISFSSAVVDQLKSGIHTAPEVYDAVTILFTAISDFTDLSIASTPFQIVNLLNDLYRIIDATIYNFDVYKVWIIKLVI